ncbi:MAG: helix-turn-helix transcriptional regulator [Mameliella sp.]|nr:helix-turn-helix transcriptional regulator [Phaeodactylibacter sp.]
MVATPHLKSLERQTEQLRAIAHPIRLSIIHLLGKQSPLTVTEIHQTLQIEQAAASHHLKILRQADVLKPSRKGRFSYYELADDTFTRVVELLNQHY